MKQKTTKQDITEAIKYLMELNRSQRKELQDLKAKLKEIEFQGKELKKEIDSLNKDTKEYTIANQSLIALRKEYTKIKKEFDTKRGYPYVLSQSEINEVKSYRYRNIYTSYGVCKLDYIYILSNDYEVMFCILCGFLNEDGSKFEKKFRTKDAFINYMDSYKL